MEHSDIFARDQQHVELALAAHNDDPLLWFNFINAGFATVEQYEQAFGHPLNYDKTLTDPAAEPPIILTCDDVNTMLRSRNYQLLRRCRLPQAAIYYRLFVDALASEVVHLCPTDLLPELIAYAVDKLEPLINLTATDKFSGEKSNAATETMLNLLTLRPRLVQRLYQQDRVSYERLLKLRPVVWSLLFSKIAKYPRAELARELQLNPLLNYDGSMLLSRVIELINRPEASLQAARKRMLIYWRLVALTEFGCELTEITNATNCLLNNVLDYGAFDALLIRERDCFFLLTTPDFEAMVDSGRNPWTNQALSEAVIAQLKFRLEQCVQNELSTKPLSLEEAIAKHTTLHEEEPVEPVRAEPDVYQELADLLHDYYVTEQGLRAISDADLPNLYEQLLSMQIHLSGANNAQGALTGLTVLLRQVPQVAPAIALALAATSS